VASVQAVGDLGRANPQVAAFLGPSLPRGVALRLVPDLVLLPPARRGDLASALAERRVAAVLIADGPLGLPERVSSGEIRRAIEGGVRVVGAAGLGGFLAAQCAGMGMEGVGAVYAGCRQGELTEADVELVHGDATQGYRPQTWPMVSVRATVHALAVRGDLSTSEAAAVSWAASVVPPGERTGPALRDQLVEAGWPLGRVRTVLRYFEDWYVDQLALDAGEALAYLAGTGSAAGR
jgi:hypothetical protein